MKTRVVNLHKEPYDIYIGRPGKGLDGYFGNPFLLAGSNRLSSLIHFREYFYDRIQSDPEYKIKVESLKGQKLGCFCKPLACHGDIYVEYLDGLDQEEYFPIFQHSFES